MENLPPKNRREISRSSCTRGVLLKGESGLFIQQAPTGSTTPPRRASASVLSLTKSHRPSTFSKPGNE
jgi:hypothetical protein